MNKPKEQAQIDTSALKKALPDVAKEYTRTTETKRFTLSFEAAQ